MPLEIIGAGFGRTGTRSLKDALETLGFGPCHHMAEVHSNPAQPAIWDALADGATIDWETVFDGNVQLAADGGGCVRMIAGNHFDLNAGRFAAAQRVGDFCARRVDDPDHAMRVFEEHNAEVQRTIAPERLLVLPVGSGWQPLCDFLGVPVPDAPYPSRNSTEEFNARRADD